MIQWIKENDLISDLQFGFMAAESSVDLLCRLMNDLGSKKDKALLLLSVDLKGAYTGWTKSQYTTGSKTMDCRRNGTPTSSTFWLAELSNSQNRLESHLPGYLNASEFHNV